MTGQLKSWLKNPITWILVLLAYFGLVNSSPKHVQTKSQEETTSTSKAVEMPEPVYTAPVPAVPVYQTSYRPRQNFYGYTCTDDCSGHQAGYEWAENNDITDPDDCGGNSNSFIEGCEAYAEEYQEEYQDDWDDEGWDDY